MSDVMLSISNVAARFDPDFCSRPSWWCRST